MTTLLATPPPPLAASGPSTRRRTASQSPRQLRSPSTSKVSPRGMPRPATDVQESAADAVGDSAVSSDLTEPEVSYLQPSSFYPLNNQHAGPFDNSKDPITGLAYGTDGVELSPDDDKEALRGIPIFTPTMEEFKDFEGYVTKTVPWGQYSGIVKIIPPDEWKQTLPPISKARLVDTPICAPIQQVFQGTNGLFSQRNIIRLKNRRIPMREWFEKCLKKEFVGPSPIDIDRARDRDSQTAKARRAAEKNALLQKRIDAKAKRAAKKAANAVKQEATETVKEEVTEPFREKTPEATEAVNEQSAEATKEKTPEAVNQVPEGEVNGMNIPDGISEENTAPPLDPPSPHSSSEDPMVKTPEPEIPEWYQQFDPETSWLPPNTTAADYTPEACYHMERKFWKTLGLGEPGWYGADMAGSLFEDEKTPWNVARLPNLLSRMAMRLPGVSNPYLYYGMWRAAFAWHVEDMDLFSINYIHFGAPKFWYAIPQASAEKFERTIAALFPLEAKACDQFLRHKAYNMSPSRLKADGIRVNQLVHSQGEFVITYPRGYHSGFNMGFNCAESVNFALESWLELGRKAKACQCFDWTVKIDVDELLGVKTEKMKEEEEKLAFQETLIEHAQKERDTKGPKRTAEGDGAAPARKRTKRPAEANESREGPALLTDHMKHTAKRSNAVAKVATSYPCVLCSSTATDDLLSVFEPDDAIRARNRATDYRIRAHEACANAITETWIEGKQMGDQVVAFAMGVNDIPKARWELKCSVCRDSKLAKAGAKIQCTKGKCPKAFHITCAIDNEDVHFFPHTRAIDVPVDGPDGPQVERQFIVEPQLLCPTHNPTVIDRKRREARDALARKVEQLQYGCRITIRTGEVEEVTFIASNPASAKVQVVMLSGLVKEVGWDRIVWRSDQTQAVDNEYAREYNSKASRRKEEEDARRSLLGPPHGIPGPPPFVSASVLMPQPGRMDQPAYSHPQLGGTAPLSWMYGAPGQTTSEAALQNSVHRMLPPPVPTPYFRSSPALPAYHLHPVQTVSQDHRAWEPVWSNSGHRMPADFSVNRLGHNPLPAGHAQQNSHRPYPNGHNQFAVHPGWHAAAPAGAASQPMAGQRAQMSTFTPTSQPGGSAPPLNNNGIDLGLSRMLQIAQRLPTITVPAIHLAGTNGKGSVSAMLEACLMAAGMTVGRYNSPHLVEPRDAVRINGSPPSAEDYTAAINRVTQICREGRIDASPFEVATSAAYQLLQASRVDVMVIECGMGGARDATNILNPAYVLAAGLTTVGLDHMTFLGDTVEKITQDKAEITPTGGLLVIGTQTYPQVAKTAIEVAMAKSAKAVVAPVPRRVPGSRQPVSLDQPVSHDRLVRSAKITILDRTEIAREISSLLSLPGDHQVDNLSLALNILATLRIDQRALGILPKLSQISDEVLTTAPAKAEWPGRCSWKSWRNPSTGVEHQILLDGAHNADSAKVLRNYIDDVRLGSGSAQPTTFIMSLSESRDKPIESVLDPLLVSGDKVALVDFTTPVEGMTWVRPAAKDALRTAASAIVSPENVWMGQGSGPGALQSALEWATTGQQSGGRGLIVVCGSLYLVADAYRLMGI